MDEQFKRIEQIAERMHRKIDKLPTNVDVFSCVIFTVSAIVAALALIAWIRWTS